MKVTSSLAPAKDARQHREEMIESHIVDYEEAILILKIKKRQNILNTMEIKVKQYRCQSCYQLCLYLVLSGCCGCNLEFFSVIAWMSLNDSEACRVPCQ